MATKYFRLTSLLFLLFTACKNENTLFIKKSASATGIRFNNKIVENDSINPIDLEFLYNGGGVAAADFNNDGKTDLYFTASTSGNKLYLNKGNLTFSDITDEARVTGEQRWANGVTVVDINNDGWLDMYICNSIKSEREQRYNLLYVNQGAGKNGVPVFREMAEEYGLQSGAYSVQSAFFDYDNDGDLDMYLLTTKLAKRDAVRFFNFNTVADTATNDIDKLYRNDWNETYQHPVFTDVSAAAGIKHPGFGLGLAIADLNKDGWKDIYVTNDFFGSDLLYINNKNGSFSEKLNQSIKHTSQNAMGNDIADINNDGLADIIAVDMNPEDNYRKKKNMNGNNYNIYQNMIMGGYNIQYVRNTLQLNMGPAPSTADSMRLPLFSDISFFAGVAETDWSWNPSMADLDNDGWRDIVITNGYPRDVTDHDFTAFRGSLGNIATKEQLIGMIPQIKIKNYVFRNNGNLQMENVSGKWGFTDASYSNGAVYADLDNDGDLDYVINNINDEAFVYESRLNNTEKNTAKPNFLVIQYKGTEKNRQGLGAIAEIYAGGQMQVHENFPTRGYLSSVEARAYFGLGRNTSVDSVMIRWPDGRTQRLEKVKTNQVLVADHRNSAAPAPPGNEQPAGVSDFTEAAGIDYVHRETDFIDFNEQRLLPHKLSQYGPGLAAGDLNGDGLDDLFIGGSGNAQGKFFMQQRNGKFLMQDLPRRSGSDIRNPENMGILFFDADADGDLDVYFANGSNEFVENSKNYRDGFLVNEGGGNMRWDSAAIPVNHASKSCVKAADYDADGDLDLFIGSRLLPGRYPLPPSAFIYRNDSRNGIVRFTDVTATVAPVLKDIGMICDALWTDFDNNGTPDLLIAGEWMPLTILKNQDGQFKNITASSGLSSFTGWWNSLAGADFDHDGDIDYVAGNLGANSFFRASEKHPVTIYAKDFDNNGSIDIVPTLYLPAENGIKKEYPAHTRDDVVEQLPGLKKNYLTYKDFAVADVRGILGKKADSAFRLQANYFQSAYIRNDGNGKFSLSALPSLLQLAPVYGMVAEDINGDGFTDIAVTGNDYGNEVSNGRYDAMYGMIAYGNGKGVFRCATMAQSGFFLPGDGKAMVKLRGADNTLLIAASQNRGPLKLFKAAAKGKPLTVKASDHAVDIKLRNGQRRREELYHGSSFLSQSSRFIFVNENTVSVTPVK